MVKSQNVKSLVGRTIGEQGYVKELVESDSCGFARYLCVCDCGIEFPKRATDIRSGKVKCCRVCSIKDRNAAKVKDLVGFSFDSGTIVLRFIERDKETKNTWWELKCGLCGTLFKDSSENICNHKTAHSCFDCRNAKLDLTGWKFGNGCEVLREAGQRGKRRYWLCECHCGVLWEIEQSHITGNHIQECKTCAAITVGQKISGPNHWNYNPELTWEDRLDKRNSAEIKNWKRQILKRDNYQCQITGSMKELEIHHINGYNWARDQRLDISNGVTVTKFMHDAFHDKYGRGNNTRAQWEEFLKSV